MRRFGLAVFIVLMVLSVTGCGKKSGLEGKVVDGKGKPVANLKIIAKQVQPIKGYEQFETTTDSDGTFSFGKLFPTSEYILFPWYEDWTEAPMRTLQYEANKLVAPFNKDGWTTEEKMKVQSGPEGHTTLLTTPIVIQARISAVEGKVIDGKKKPLEGIKIIAKQVKPVPGYEQFEATTGSDGTFSFEKLFPMSQYVLFPLYDDWTEAPMRTLRYEADKLVAPFNKDGWTIERKMKVQSGPEGQTIMLASPMVIQPCISTVTGKLVDDRKRPMQGIKIVAKQVNPIPGYEQFEATTGADGSFSFTKLYPDSKYRLIPGWNFKTDGTWTVRTSGEQEVLEASPSFRFILANGVVSDLRTGLQWAAKDNGRNINWHNAHAYCQNYSGGGHTDWRLPTVSELKGLYKAGIRSKRVDIINITACEPWASETRGSRAAYFSFCNGRSWTARPSSSYLRALPVRSRIPIVKDAKTGFEWKVGPDKDTTWNEAKSWVERLKSDGGRWRMPTLYQLEGLYRRGGGNYNITPLLKTTGSVVWSGETKGSSHAWAFHFTDGSRYPHRRDYSPLKRVFAVRSQRSIELARNVDSLGLKFAKIPAGNFMMGSGISASEAASQYGGQEKWYKKSEHPQHRVTISRSFYMQTTEVTQGQWKQVMGNNPSHFKNCGDNCPVERVSWNDVQEFIRKLNQMEGGNRYRLPTDAEWEYACRSGSTTRFYFGNDKDRLGEYAWYWGNSRKHPHWVGEKQPNSWGLYDMHGNVWEWCQDWYGDYPSGSVTDPKGPSSGSGRVLRGGDWRKAVRSAFRSRGEPSGRNELIGFRLARN